MKNYGLIAIFGVLALVALSGCTMQPGSDVQETISSEAEALSTMINVSNDIESIGSAFDDIDSLLG